jgi:hypothetical protein
MNNADNIYIPVDCYNVALSLLSLIHYCGRIAMIVTIPSLRLYVCVALVIRHAKCVRRIIYHEYYQ